MNQRQVIFFMVGFILATLAQRVFADRRPTLAFWCGVSAAIVDLGSDKGKAAVARSGTHGDCEAYRAEADPRHILRGAPL